MEDLGFRFDDAALIVDSWRTASTAHSCRPTSPPRAPRRPGPGVPQPAKPMLLLDLRARFLTLLGHQLGRCDDDEPRQPSQGLR